VSATYDISKHLYDALYGLRRVHRREYCELCNLRLSEGHPHLLHVANHEVLCACEACAVLFSHRSEQRGFLRIPRDARRLADFTINDAEWSALRLPIDLAFFVQRSSDERPTAYYPSPAGCTESLLELDAWTELVHRNVELANITPDVEALLVNRTQGRRDHLIAPLDQCYKLAGLIRRHWRGLSGGEQVWHEIGGFFDALDAHTLARKESAHA
jgi:hypothetical protein